MVIRPEHMIKAIEMLAKIIPIEQLSRDEHVSGDALDYLEEAQFQQIFVGGDMNFVYKGDERRWFGQLSSIGW